MRRKNEKGGAAIIAVLVVIMLVAVGSAALVVTGRNTIQESDAVDAAMEADREKELNKTEESSLADDSSKTEEEPEKSNLYPTLSDSYKDISIKDLSCKSAILIDAENNQTLAGEDVGKKIYPASLTKLLTLLVAVENIDDLDATYKFTADDIDPLIEDNASRAGFEAGEEVTMKDLLYSSILVSGADGTVGLANSVAGSEKAFAELMNQKIKELGLTGTEFVNSSGLHDKKHFSTVQDLAVITKAVYDNETCRKIITADTYKTSKTKEHKDGIELTSIVASRFEGYYVDVDGDDEADAKILGGKTGFTDEALYTLSTVCEYKDHIYICVTAKSKDEFKSVEDTIAIYERYLPGGKGSDKTESKTDSKTDSQKDSSSDESKKSTETKEDKEDYEA